MTVRELIKRLETQDPDDRVYLSPADDPSMLNVNDVEDVVETPDGHVYIYGVKETEE